MKEMEWNSDHRRICWPK